MRECISLKNEGQKRKNWVVDLTFLLQSHNGLRKCL